MIKYSIVLIKWDILNNDRIRQKLCTPKNDYNENPLYIYIYIYINKYKNLLNKN